MHAHWNDSERGEGVGRERGGEREGKKEKGEETRGKERVRGKEKVEKVQDGRSRDRETG